jgi:hypothetical protein
MRANPCEGETVTSTTKRAVPAVAALQRENDNDVATTQLMGW